LIFVLLIAFGAYFAPELVQACLFAATLIILAHAGIKILAILSPKPVPSVQAEVIEWPRYTVLVPLYREANVAASLIAHLAKLDYPKDKLEIFIICEADDTVTCPF